MIDVSKTSIYFEKKKGNKNFILEDISLRVDSAEVFGLLGPNGAGKTTFIKTLLGLHKSYKGEININGKTIKANRGKYRESLGYVPEDIRLPEELTVRSFIQYYSSLYTKINGLLSESISTALDVTGLYDIQDKKINTLSKGMKKRLLISHAIVHQPDLLILDEPFEGMDPLQKIQIRNYLHDRTKSGKTTLLSSHELGEISKSCNRVAIMYNNKLQSPVDLMHNTDLETLFKQAVNY